MVNIRVMQDKRHSSDGWRVDPSISGGGHFNDISPHQLDILIDIFGEVERTSGFSSMYENGDTNTKADDLVTGQIKFSSGVIANGQWYFRATSALDGEDSCEIIGEKGIIKFGFFGSLGKISYRIEDGTEIVEEFPTPKHIQQPMLENVVQYFQSEKNAYENPCSIQDAIVVMKIINSFTASSPV